MEWNARWVPLTGTGVEQLHLQQNDEGVFVDSVVIGTKHGQSFRAWYKIHCDQGWKVQTCILHQYKISSGLGEQSARPVLIPGRSIADA